MKENELYNEINLNIMECGKPLTIFYHQNNNEAVLVYKDKMICVMDHKDYDDSFFDCTDIRWIDKI